MGDCRFFSEREPRICGRYPLFCRHRPNPLSFECMSALLLQDSQTWVCLLEPPTFHPLAFTCLPTQTNPLPPSIRSIPLGSQYSFCLVPAEAFHISDFLLGGADQHLGMELTKQEDKHAHMLGDVERHRGVLKEGTKLRDTVDAVGNGIDPIRRQASLSCGSFSSPPSDFFILLFYAESPSEQLPLPP